MDSPSLSSSSDSSNNNNNNNNNNNKSSFLVSFKAPNKTTKWRRRTINKQDIKDFFPGATGALEVEDEMIYFENDVADLSEYNNKIINVIMNDGSSSSHSNKRVHSLIDSTEIEPPQNFPALLNNLRGDPGVVEIFNDKDILLLRFEIFKNIGRATISIEIILRNICGPFMNSDYTLTNKETKQTTRFDKLPARILHGSYIIEPVSDAPSMHNSMQVLYDPFPPHSILASMSPESPKKFKSSDDDIPIEPMILSNEEIEILFTSKVRERDGNKCVVKQSEHGLECCYIVSPVLWNQHPRKVHDRMKEVINDLPNKIYSPQNGILLSKEIADIFNRGGCSIFPWRGKFIFVSYVRTLDEYDGKEINFSTPPLSTTLEFSFINNTTFYIKNNFVIL